MILPVGIPNVKFFGLSFLGDEEKQPKKDVINTSNNM